MDSLYTLLQKIREKPGLYIERKCFIYLYYFIVGYNWRINEENMNYRDSLEGFNEFVSSYYNDKFIGGRNWKCFILDHTNSEEEAFDKFYELLDEFVKTKEDNQGTI